MSSKRIVGALVVLLLLAGCSGMGLGDSAQETGQQSSANLDAPGRQSGGAESATTGAFVQVDAPNQTAIIRSGRMVVEISNFTQSRAAVVEQAREYGGYVNSSNRELHRAGDRTWLTGSLVVRVPSDNYSAIQENVSTQGTVVSERTQTEDVTDQLVDLEARLSNLQQRRDRLRTFYDQANDTEELLSVEAELSEVQGQIERLQAQQRSLEQRVAYSTLRIELEEDAPGPDRRRTQFHEQPLTTAFTNSLTALYVFGRTVLVALTVALPWLIVLSVVGIGATKLLRRTGLPVVGSEHDDGPATDPETASEADDET